MTPNRRKYPFFVNFEASVLFLNSRSLTSVNRHFRNFSLTKMRGENPTRRAIFRLGVDTLIANILVIIIIRLHRSDSWRLQPFATDGVAWSVCLWVSLSVGHVCEPCNKRLNLSRCRWGRADLGGWEGTTFWGCPAHWKAWESLLRQEKSITSTAAAGGKPSALPVSH